MRPSNRQLMNGNSSGSGGDRVWSSNTNDMVSQSIAATRQMLSNNVHLTNDIVSLDDPHNSSTCQQQLVDESDDLIIIMDPDEMTEEAASAADEDICLATFGCDHYTRQCSCSVSSCSHSVSLPMEAVTTFP